MWTRWTRVAERREALPGEREGVRVAVESDEDQLGKALEERLGVAAQPEGGVDEHGAGALKSGGQQLERALEHHGGVQSVLGHEESGSNPSGLIPIRCDLAPGKWSQGARLRVGHEALEESRDHLLVGVGEVGFGVRVVGVPGGGVPDLGAGARPDHGEVAVEARVLAQHRRDRDAALPVRDLLGRAAEEQAQVVAALLAERREPAAASARRRFSNSRWLYT